MAPIDINNQEIDSITLNGNTDIDTVEVNGQEVFSSVNAPLRSERMVAWYRFEDGDGRDYASNAEFPSITWADNTQHNGSPSSASFQGSGGVKDVVTQSSGGGCFNTTSNGFLSINSAAVAISGEPEISEMTWINWNADPNDNNDHNIFDSDSPNDYPNFYINDTDNGPRVIFGNVSTATSFNFNTNRWYHLAFTYSSSNGIRIYVDAQLVASTSSTSGAVPSNLDDYNYGAGGGGGSGYLDALVDDGRIYNTALSSSEINQIYQNTDP